MGLVAIVIAVVLVVILVHPGGSSGSPLDSALKRTADRIATTLNHPSGRLPVQDSSFRSFQAWYYDMKLTLPRAARLGQRGQFLQAQVSDPNTLPPVFLSISLPGHPSIPLEGSFLSGVAHSGKAAYTTVQQGPLTYRVYAAPLRTPSVLQPVGVTGTFEVIQPE